MFFHIYYSSYSYSCGIAVLAQRQTDRKPKPKQEIS